MRGNSGRDGFTLIEIMIVVAILAILAAIAIPNFLKYRRNSQASLCVSNLAAMQTAIEQCRFAGKEVTEANLFGPGAYIKAKPVCPSGGEYVLPAAESDEVACTFSDVDAEDRMSWHKLTQP